MADLLCARFALPKSNSNVACALKVLLRLCRLGMRAC